MTSRCLGGLGCGGIGALGAQWGPDSPVTLAIAAAAERQWGHVQYPYELRVRSGYAARVDPVTHEHHFHEGLDIPAPKGTPVIAVLPGVVETVYRDGVGKGEINGNAIGLKCGAFTFFYLHLSWVGVKEGDAVEKYRVMGGVGSTGRSTGPHLHFQVYVNGRTIDPRILYPGGLFQG